MDARLLQTTNRKRYVAYWIVPEYGLYFKSLLEHVKTTDSFATWDNYELFSLNYNQINIF